MDLLGKFPLQLLRLAHIQIGLLDRLEDLIGDLRLLPLAEPVRTVFIIQRNRRSVVYGLLEIVDGNIIAEGPHRELIISEERRPRESDARCRGQQMKHILRKLPVLAAVRLIRQDEHIMIGIDRLCARLIEFLDERENIARIAMQLFQQILPAGRDELRRLGRAQQTAHFKSPADLRIQLIPVRQHHDRRRAAELPPDLLGEERHGIALAGALRMPENAQLSVAQLPFLIGLYRRIDAQILVIPCKDLGRRAAGMVEEDEIFKNIQKTGRGAHAAEHRFQCDRALVRGILREPLPLVEKFIPASQRSHAGFLPVAEDDKRIRMEEARHRIQIIRVIVRIGIPYIHVVPFQLHENQGDAVHETDDIRPSPVQRPLHPQLLHREEMIPFRMEEINQHGAPFLRGPVPAPYRNGDSVTEKSIFLLINLKERCRGQVPLQYLCGLPDLGLRHPRIQPGHSRMEILRQQRVPGALPSEGAVPAEGLLLCHDHGPAQLLQQLARRIADHYIFRIFPVHTITSLFQVKANLEMKYQNCSACHLIQPEPYQQGSVQNKPEYDSTIHRPLPNFQIVKTGT